MPGLNVLIEIERHRRTQRWSSRGTTPTAPPLPIYCITTGNSPHLNQINYADGEASSIIKSWINIRFIERHRGIKKQIVMLL
jgi:hypothetical protein